MSFLERHPVWRHGLRTRRSSLPYLLAGVLATAVMVFSGTAGWCLWGLWTVAYLIGSPIHAFAQAYDVVLKERRTRRLDILQAAPLDSTLMVVGFWLTAQRRTMANVLSTGLPVFAVPLGQILTHSPGDVDQYLKLVFVTVSGLVVTWLFMGAAGILLALHSNGKDDKARSTGALWLVLAVVASVLHAALTSNPTWLDEINPLIFLRVVFDDLPKVDFTNYFPHLFYLAMTGILLVIASSRWERFGDETIRPNQATHKVPETYRKPPFLRAPFLADAWNRGRRELGEHPVASALSGAFMVGLAWVWQPMAFTGGGVFVFLVFLFWSITRTSWTVNRQKDPARLAVLLSTGMAPSHMLRQQWLASILSMAPVLGVFLLSSVPLYVYRTTNLIDLPGGLVATVAVPMVAVALGTAFTVVSLYQLSISWRHER